MWKEFFDAIWNAQSTPTERPFVQANARAITESTPPIPAVQTEGGLAYPYPGKGVSGESQN